ncbi:MAG: type VI secretion system contractile sheath large subunit, partial [Aquabacterium sp.]|nr:type VI secretion system contractile sheath large subunit [Aquabacterium sp.]
MSAQPQAAASAAAAEASLLDQIVADSRVARSSTEHERAKDLIAELVSEVLQGTVVMSSNLGATLDARIADIDQLISEQLSAILHAPEFQKLEGSWRGLHYLCKQTSTGAMLKIKMMQATKKELVKDFKSAIDFDQSALFKK